MLRRILILMAAALALPPPTTTAFAQATLPQVVSSNGTKVSTTGALVVDLNGNAKGVPGNPTTTTTNPADPTGLVAGYQVMNDDTFDAGMQGWVQLFTPGGTGASWGGPSSTYITGTLNRITYATPRLMARTPDVAAAQIMGIKRLSQPSTSGGEVLLEFWTHMSLVNLDVSRPLYFWWGVDSELANGNRNFCEVAWTNYNTSSSSRPLTFQYQSQNGTWVNLPTPAGFDPLTYAANENKAGPIAYVALLVNTATGYLDGFRYDNAGGTIALGGLAPNGYNAASIAAFNATYGQCFAAGNVVSYGNGLNPAFGVVNRPDASATSASIEIFHQRTTNLSLPAGDKVLYPLTAQHTEETNWLVSNYPTSGASGSYNTAEIACEPGAVYDWNALLDGITGTPTAGAITITNQVAPIEFDGLNFDSETSGILRPWVSISATDTFLGQYLLDGNWPSPAFSYSDTVGKEVARSMRCPVTGRFARLNVAWSGVSPTTATIKITIAVSRRWSQAQ